MSINYHTFVKNRTPIPDLKTIQKKSSSKKATEENQFEDKKKVCYISKAKLKTCGHIQAQLRLCYIIKAKLTTAASTRISLQVASSPVNQPVCQSPVPQAHCPLLGPALP